MLSVTHLNIDSFGGRVLCGFTPKFDIIRDSCSQIDNADLIVSVRLQFIDNAWLHLILCVIDILAVQCHEVADLLVISDCILGLVRRQVEVAFLLHAV